MALSRNRTLLAAALAFAVLAHRVDAQDHEAGAHEHGVAHLDLALDSGRLEIKFTAPGSDVVGFEGQPADASDVAKVRSAQATLAKAAILFGFEPAGACIATGVADIDPPAAALQAPGSAAQPIGNAADAHDHHDEHQHPHDDGEGTGGHGDWSASYTFDCSAPAAVIVNLFDAVPSLQTIHSQVIAPGAQTGAELTPAARRIGLGGAR